ncbi:MAG: NADH-quinone oxidoreductase subunit F, partial [Chloroflexi bacterium]|nr:NADH-quinone oxidoreductase subunit F [Chloroflexota bacterium]
MNFEELKNQADEKWNQLNDSPTPVIRVGTAMCGHASGAFRVIQSLKTLLAEKKIDAIIEEVGCIGLCYAEPLIDIKKQGKSRLFFNNVSVNNIEEIVEEYLVNNKIKNASTLGYLGKEGSVFNEPDLNTLPGIALQERIALRNAGHTAPGDIFQYIANGGYSGLNKALSTMEPSDVI